MLDIILLVKLNGAYWRQSMTTSAFALCAIRLVKLILVVFLFFHIHQRRFSVESNVYSYFYTSLSALFDLSLSSSLTYKATHCHLQHHIIFLSWEYWSACIYIFWPNFSIRLASHEQFSPTILWHCDKKILRWKDIFPPIFFALWIEFFYNCLCFEKILKCNSNILAKNLFLL